MDGSISGSCVIENLDRSVYMPDSSLESLGDQPFTDGDDIVSPLPSAKNAKVVPLHQPHVVVLDDVQESLEAVSLPAVVQTNTDVEATPQSSPGLSTVLRRGWPVPSPQGVVSPAQAELSVDVNTPARPMSSEDVMKRTGDGAEEGETRREGQGRMRRGTRLRLWLWSALTTFSMLQVSRLYFCVHRCWRQPLL